jgi:hypothetical protein
VVPAAVVVAGRPPPRPKVPSRAVDTWPSVDLHTRSKTMTTSGVAGGMTAAVVRGGGDNRGAAVDAVRRTAVAVGVVGSSTGHCRGRLVAVEWRRVPRRRKVIRAGGGVGRRRRKAHHHPGAAGEREDSDDRSRIGPGVRVLVVDRNPISCPRNDELVLWWMLGGPLAGGGHHHHRSHPSPCWHVWACELDWRC